VAGARHFYLLSCEAYGDDGDEIAIDWGMAWGERVSHIQKSLTVPGQ